MGVYCAHCGAARPEDAKFCVSCGRAVDPAPDAALAGGVVARAPKAPHPWAEPRPEPGWLLPAAVLIVVAATFMLFLLLPLMLAGVGEIPQLAQFATTIAAAPLAGIGWVHRNLRDWQARRSRSPTEPRLDSRQELHQAWYQAATYAGLVLVFLLQVGSFVGAFIVTWITGDQVMGEGGGGGGGFVLALGGAYLLGRWIGAWAADRHLLAAVLAAVIATLLGVLIDAAFVGIVFGEDFGALVAGLLGLRLFVHLLPWTIAGATGVWLARRRPALAFVRVVADRLPDDSLRKLADAATDLADDAFMAPDGDTQWAPTHRVPIGGLPAWTEPNPGVPPVTTLHPGTEIHVLGRQGDWALVSAANGWKGWVDGRPLGE